jgi:hypothetical protein
MAIDLLKKEGSKALIGNPAVVDTINGVVPPGN